MSQTNTHTNNGQNWYQNSGRGGQGQGPNGSGHSDRRNNRGNKSIVKYSFKGKMKDGPVSKLTITETGHRPSQFKKLWDALSVFCAVKNYGGLDQVLCTRRDQVEDDFMPAYPNANLWSRTHQIQVTTVAALILSCLKLTPTPTMVRTGTRSPEEVDRAKEDSAAVAVVIAVTVAETT